jgi:hypothetical protein
MDFREDLGDPQDWAATQAAVAGLGPAERGRRRGRPEPSGPPASAVSTVRCRVFPDFRHRFPSSLTDYPGRRMSLGERERAAAYFSTWHERHYLHNPRGDDVLWLHNRLLHAAYDVVSSEARRRLAITTAGVPIVYSHKSSRRMERSPFRILVEPGGIGITVAEQVRLSRDLLNDVFDRLGWQGAGRRVDAVLASLLPTDPTAYENWHGGLGFGIEADENALELRLYCNVRHGELTSRWQRFADAIGEFADQRAESAFREILEIAAPRAVPAGVALAVANGEMCGIRLYVGLLEATAASAVAAAPASFASSAPSIRRLVDSYRSWFGALGTQDITLAYDFAVREGVLLPAVGRYKVDVWCEPANEFGPEQILDWAEDFIDWLQLSPSELRAFFSEIEGAFPGATFQYLSLGCRSGEEEFTTYCIPGRSLTADHGRSEVAVDGTRAT